MTLAQVYTTLAATGLPVTYYAWPDGEAPFLPWIAIVESSSDNFAADGIAYGEIKQVTVELYTKTKDPAAEALVQTALTGAGIYWDKTETYIESEQCFLNSYDIEV